MKQIIYIFIHPLTAVITTLTVDVAGADDAQLLDDHAPHTLTGANRGMIDAMLKEGQSLCNWHVVEGGESHGECNGRITTHDTRA